jgi:hypothetical protein
MDVIQLWKDAMNDEVSYRIVMVFVLVCMILFAVYIVGWFRNLALGKNEHPLYTLTEIERLKAEGKIDFVEYHRLKKVAAETMRAAMLTSSKLKTDNFKAGKSTMPVGIITGQGGHLSLKSNSARSEESPSSIDFSEVDSDEG